MAYYHGVLQKMNTEHLEEVQYYLQLTDHTLHMNDLLNKNIELVLEGFQCLSCSQQQSIYRQGLCKKCFFALPSAGDWIMRPELSKAHLGIEDRDLAYEQKVQLAPHIVYLANTGKVKVGVTRKTQVPTRWIDQGAHEALEILEAPNRYLAGITEVALKEFVADKTNWRTMLKNDIVDTDLQALKIQLQAYIPDEAQAYFITDNTTTLVNFPVYQYPKKVKSLNLQKQNTYQGRLVGIKGQYLIFEDETVFNVRSNEGVVVQLFVHD